MSTTLPYSGLLSIHLQKKSTRKSLSKLRILHFTFILWLTLLSASIGHTQVNTYVYTTTTGNTLETGGFSNLLSTFLDNDVSTTANIGFTFRFGGINYTTFSVTSNGLMNLGGTAVPDYNNVTGSLSGPYLSPYWDDNYTDANGNVQYKVMGSAGSRKLVVEDGNKPVVVKVEGVYPNPASNLLTIEIASPNKQAMTITLNDITGKTVLQKQIPVDAGNNIVPLDISQLANNYYLLKVTDAAGFNHASLKIAVIK